MGAEHQIAFFLRELAAPEPQRRAAAVKGLGRTGRPEHAGVLVAVADDRAPEVRAAAALGLGRLGVPEAGAEVLPVLMGDADAGVRRRASLAAVRLGLAGPAVTEAFARLLRDPDHHLRNNALAGLDALGAPGDAGALVRLLDDPDDAVRGRARRLVYRFKDDPAVQEDLIGKVGQSTGAAFVGILHLLPGPRVERLLDSLLPKVRAPSPQVRIATARQLSRLRRPEVTDALVAALEDERDAQAAAELLEALTGRGDRRVTEPAERWLRDPVAGLPAVRALSDLGTGAAVDHLRWAFADPEAPGPVRAAAATAVGELGGFSAVWMLLPFLDDPDAGVRTGVVDGLGALVRDGLRPWERRPVAWALIAVLRTGRAPVPHVRDALDGLPEALPGLRRLADGTASGSPRARRAAAEVLESLTADHHDRPRRS